MGFINKKAHNVRQDRFNKSQNIKIEVKPEMIETEIITPMIVEPEIVEIPIIEENELSIEAEALTQQPKKKRNKKTQENNNVETID